jgi:hypothetical protein
MYNKYPPQQMLFPQHSPLVSSYIKFCTSYRNPPWFGGIFTHLVPLFTFPLLTDVYTTSLVDIMMLITT